MDDHTPGPWRWSKKRWYLKSQTHYVLSVKETLPSEANARLIAAAPDMLDALEGLVDRATCYCGDCIDMPVNHGETILRAKAAIAKAKG